MTPPPGLVVVKVGGSLYDHPQLGPGLRAYLDQLDATKVLVVAGGGPLADGVRLLDEWQALPAELSHFYAMSSLVITSQFLKHIAQIRDAEWACTLRWWEHRDQRVLFDDSMWFLGWYEKEYGPVPHTWDVTTDSIAGYAAGVANARLVLLKSTDVPPGTPWEEAAARGWVDAHFPAVVRKHHLQVEAVDFRRWLDALPG